MKKFFLLFFIFSLNAQAAPGVCAKFSARLLDGRRVTISSFATNYLPEFGFQDVGATVSGAMQKTCGEFFTGDDVACGIKVKNVHLISDTDCWDF